MIYPGCTPEFRVLLKDDGSQVFQVRHVNISVGYFGLWKDVPVETEANEKVKINGEETK